MENRPSQDPRDLVIRAALADAAAIAGIVSNEFQATYTGPDRAAYLTTLSSWLTDLGGIVEGGPAGAVVRFPGRDIAIRFGPVSGHR